MDKEMAAHVHERLARMDEAIELMQDHPQRDRGALHRTLPGGGIDGLLFGGAECSA